MSEDKRVIKEKISKDFFESIYMTIQNDIYRGSVKFLSESESGELHDLFESNRKKITKKMDEYGYFYNSEVE